ncbi:MAG: ATP-binding cassette domain-containing protein [Erysipelotrichaceae bacterium]|nr:ATP-binding cassette domain-containing protein [Erysipelotrichaceae bacterium]
MLKIKNVQKTFHPNSPDSHIALRDLSLEVAPGDFVTIIGSNGAGKSTLFNAICGTFELDKGQIFLDGKDITHTPDYIRAKNIGRLFQDPLSGTASEMTVLENLALAQGKGGWLSITRKSEKEFFREQFKALNMQLEDRLDTPVGLLSGGQRQALTLLMATINPPKLLLLDEHTAALDPNSAAKIMELTKKIVKENRITCLMITHNMQQALDVGNRTLLMHDGKILMDLSGEERENMSVEDLLSAFKTIQKESFDNDRMLLINE